MRLPQIALSVTLALGAGILASTSTSQAVVAAKPPVPISQTGTSGTVQSSTSSKITNRLLITRHESTGPVFSTVETPKGMSTTTFMSQLVRAGKGEYSVSVTHKTNWLLTSGVNDPYAAGQWSLSDMQIPAAWAKSTGVGVTVAVIDTGVDGTHPDLSGQVLQGVDYVSPGGNGWVDANGHGTHVSGIIAALSNNGIGIAGNAPGVKILPIRVLDADGSGYDSDIIQGITYAVSHGAKIINLSLGSTDPDPAELDALNAAQAAGVLVVAAAGNSGNQGNPPIYPAAYDYPVAVAALDYTGAPTYFSSFGDYVDVSAPGSSIISTYLNAGYTYMSGTSMASPEVASVAALIWSLHPDWTETQVREALLSSARDVYTPGYDTHTGSGDVDALAALNYGVSSTPSPSLTTSSPSPSPTSSSPTATPSPTVTTTPTPTITPTPTLPPSVTPSPTLSPSTTPSPTPSTTPTTPPAPVVSKVSLSLNPSTVSRGGTTSLYGAALTSAGKGVAGKTVNLYQLSGRTWTLVGTTLSNSVGNYSFKRLLLSPTFFQVKVGSVGSAQVVVKVLPTLSPVRVRYTSNRVYLTSLISGPGTTYVYLQKWSGSKWATLTYVKTSGVISFTRVRTSKAVSTRLLVVGASNWATATTKTLGIPLK